MSPEKSEINVLFTAIGRRVELIECLRDSARKENISVKVYSVDAKPELSIGCFFSDYYSKSPKATDKNYLEWIKKFIIENRINIIIPTTDYDLISLASIREEIAERYNCWICTPDIKMIRIFANKKSTSDYLKSINVPVPLTAYADDELSNVFHKNTKIILKPTYGANSIGLKTLNNIEEIPSTYKNKNYTVQEYIRGKEFTTTMYFNKRSSIMDWTSHHRMSVRGGGVSVGKVTQNIMIDNLIHELQKVENCFGLMNFQCISDQNNNPKVIEVNSRVGGGFPLAHKSGATFFTHLLREHAGRSFIGKLEKQSDITYMRYEKSIQID